MFEHKYVSLLNHYQAFKKVKKKKFFGMDCVKLMVTRYTWFQTPY